MRKVYIYSQEEEEQINRKLGYTEKDYDNYPYRDDFHNKYGEQQQFTISLTSIKKSIYYLFHSKCPDCNVKLGKIKELRYVGFRHAASATGGNYKKAIRLLAFANARSIKKGIKYFTLILAYDRFKTR